MWKSAICIQSQNLSLEDVRTRTIVQLLLNAYSFSSYLSSFTVLFLYLQLAGFYYLFFALKNKATYGTFLCQPCIESNKHRSLPIAMIIIKIVITLFTVIVTVVLSSNTY